MDEVKQSEGVQPEGKKKKKSGFFAVDRRSWARVCGLGMNPAVAYLVIASGTLADNKTSEWSALAIEKYTGMARSRAKKAIDILLRYEVIKIKDYRSPTKPIYELTPFHRGLCIKNLDSYQKTNVLKDIEARKPYGSATGKKQNELIKDHLQPMLRKGFAEGFNFEPVSYDEKPDYIWLPNEIITGTSKRETPPIEKIRQTQDVLTLRLFIDLYHSHNLTDDCGISRDFIYEGYKRQSLGERYEWLIWGFNSPNLSVYRCRDCAPHVDHTKAKDAEKFKEFWERLKLLRDELGLITFRPYLFESKDGEPIYPAGQWQQGKGADEGIENEVGESARFLVMALLEEWQEEMPQQEKAKPSDDDEYDDDEYDDDEKEMPPKTVQSLLAIENGSYEYVLPMYKHSKNVVLIGVGRLRYRPHTKKTSQWFGKLNKACGRWSQIFTEARAKVNNRPQREKAVGT